MASRGETSVAALRLPRERFHAGSWAQAAAWYGITLAGCIIALVVVLELWRADLHVPFVYNWDGMLNSLWVKSVIESGWYFHNGMVGAPLGLSMLDYPMSDGLNFLVIRIIALFTHDYALVMNLFFLATFPLTAASCLFVFRRLGISWPVASAGSLLFAFIPFHLMRGELHLLLTGIYVIPLTCLAVLRLGSASPPLLRRAVKNSAPVRAGEKAGNQDVVEKSQLDNSKFLWDWSSLRTGGYALIALLTASAGIYYAVFACFFLAVAGITAAAGRRSLKRLAVAGILIVIIGAGLLINIAPSILYRVQNGSNPALNNRYAIEAQQLGLTPSMLLLPSANHRLGFMAALSNNYQQDVKLLGPVVMYVNENNSAALGVIGAAGFLILLGWLAFRVIRRGRDSGDGETAGAEADETSFKLRQTMDSLSILNLAGLLLGTMGGFGLIVALIVSPEIRAYNRISVYLGFFAILAVLLLLEEMRRRYFRTSIQVMAFTGALVLIAAGGIYDQTNSLTASTYAPTKAKYVNDDIFVKNIESSLPAGSMIFQLPYVAFPESAQVNNMPDYEQLRGYLHSTTLRWSYGAMKGRQTDSWQKQVAAEPAEALVRDLRAAGFSGIWVDRDGYTDNGAAIESQLETELNRKPVSDDSGSLLFFDIRS